MINFFPWDGILYGLDVLRSNTLSVSVHRDFNSVRRKFYFGIGWKVIQCNAIGNQTCLGAALITGWGGPSREFLSGHENVNGLLQPATTYLSFFFTFGQYTMFNFNRLSMWLALEVCVVREQFFPVYWVYPSVWTAVFLLGLFTLWSWLFVISGCMRVHYITSIKGMKRLVMWLHLAGCHSFTSFIVIMVFLYHYNQGLWCDSCPCCVCIPGIVFYYLVYCSLKLFHYPTFPIFAFWQIIRGEVLEWHDWYVPVSRYPVHLGSIQT
jgi:hypothetical protein